jgi:endonuclease III
MSEALNLTTGITVDSHVTRISNRLGWTNEKNSDSVKKDLEDWMPLYILIFQYNQ